MSRQVSPHQLGFSVEGEKFTLPQSLMDEPYGKKLIEILAKNSLFKEKPKNGQALLIDLTGNSPTLDVYNPDNWQKENQKPENLINPNYSVLIVIAPQIISFDEFSQLISENKPNLNLDGGEIFILETNLSLTPEELSLIKDQREKVLKDLGFIKGKIVSTSRPRKNQPISEILTQARLKKIAEHHPHEVDLLTPRPDDPPWKIKWRKSIIPKIIQMYRQMGFNEIDVSEIEERLRHSKNPPADLAKAKDGFGVNAKAPCGCQIKVSLDGEVTILTHCQEHPDGIPNKKNFSVKNMPKYKVGETELNQFCGDCGRRLIQSVRRIKSYPNGNTSLRVEISCPNCGLLSTKQKYISTKLIGV